ncbi:MAG: hypothetical protein AAF297_02810 [Planctomycetota bacterium]
MEGSDTRWTGAADGGLTLAGVHDDDAATLASEDLVHDELAELFMGPHGDRGDGGDDRADVRDAAADAVPTAGAGSRAGSRVGPIGRATSNADKSRAGIEALLLGHLPVRASLWVRQYASSLAEVSGSVGLVRLGRSGANVERHTPVSDTDATIGWWVVRVDEVDQPALVQACADGSAAGPGPIDRITVLTGADDAAVIACYRLLKGLAAELDRMLGDGEGPELSVSIVGVDSDRAKDAYRRLREATQRFLGRGLMQGPAVERAGMTRASVIGSWEGTTGVESLIETIRGGAFAGKAAAATTATASVPTPTRPVEVCPPTASAPPADTPNATESVASSNAGEPDPSARLEHALNIPADPVVASMIEGLGAVAIECPANPEVEFARDAAGGLHAITRFGREGLDAAMSAAAWARAHRGLLSQIDSAIDVELLEDGCIVHVCGDDARELRGLGESDVRTHLLRRVETANGDVWVCDPLN